MTLAEDIETALTAADRPLTIQEIMDAVNGGYHHVCTVLFTMRKAKRVIPGYITTRASGVGARRMTYEVNNR